MSSSKNLEYKKTSFLNKSNSAFIEQMYLNYINNDLDIPESWKEYFSEFEDDYVLKTYSDAPSVLARRLQWLQTNL